MVIAGPAATRVLVVDDHPDFRASASALLRAEGFVVVGEAATGAEAADLVARIQPDLVLLDVRLPDVDGFAVAQALARLPHPPAVVLVSSRDAVTYGPRLRAAPARGFLPKSQLSGTALRALLE
jgi:DNA-binding NarL/FixJ family response regulator